ncbi:MAG: class I SAM-dependent methyltransferase [Cyanobacteria bacterium TGS_CYA1]|nr:class I SAM-dependent methyltransferase [Cyanobacteria bacterium TGS_CYA1]
MKIFRDIVLQSLTAMPQGKLSLTLPDGSSLNNRSMSNGIDANIGIRSNAFFDRCIKYGAIGFAESYIAGEWSTSNLTEVIEWFIANADESTVLEGSRNKNSFLNLLHIINKYAHWLRPNTVSKAKENIHEHYDLGNEFFSLFLDQTMTYSSAIFANASQSLQEAQINKYETICRKLLLKKSDHILEIGCGWGGFACYAAKKYGVKITGITISQEQFEYAKSRIAAEDLSGQVEILLKDFRHMEGKFDKIVSIEMVEALGDAQVDPFFKACSNLLEKDGLVAIQMISSSDSRYEQLKNSVDFIQKHIFPGSLLLSLERVIRSTSTTSDLQLDSVSDYAESYAKTLRMWRDNFNAAESEIRKLGFGDEFIRKWNYYFCYCEAAFATRQIGLLQVVLTRPNNKLLAQARALK